MLKIHALHSNVYAANNLIRAYAECGQMGHALKVFDETPLRNLITWNLMIVGCNKNLLFDESWKVFRRMHSAGECMDEFTYGSVLSACGGLEDVARGLLVYGVVMKNGFFTNGYVRAGMIDMFARCCRVEDGLRVLHDSQCENVVCWNAVVSGAVKNKNNWVALELFRQMCFHGGSLTPNSFTFSSALTACASVEEFELGKSIHGRVIKSGDGDDVFVGTAIVDLYAKSGAMCDAMKQFKLMPTHNVVSCTAIISGFVKKGDSASAISFLNGMLKMGVQVNNYTISSVLATCANPAMFKEAQQIHCRIFKIGLDLDPVVKASLINTYSKVGAINLSEKAFAETRGLKEVGIWANMISSFVQSKYYEKAIILFKGMLREGIRPHKFSISSILSIIESLTLGRQVHSYTLKVGVVYELSVGSSIFTMYSKCGDLAESLKAFEQVEVKDNVSLTSMIAGFAEHGCADKAIKLFQEMGFQESFPDEKMLAAVLNACSALHSLKPGREIHGFILRCGLHEKPFIDEALVNMYSKCGDLNSAKIVFHMMLFKGEVSWSSLISGLSKRGHFDEAFCLFREMLLSYTSVDVFTISSLLGTIAIISSKSGFGPQLHAYTVKTSLHSEASVGSSLVMMYSKCGEISDCIKVFGQIRDPNLISWSAMIASYAHHGKGYEALELFDLMKKSGIEPDSVTFVDVLSACSYTGLVEEGYFHLKSMIRDYGIEPGMKHYACMVDILGRAGRLDEAKWFIMNMPIKPDIFVWETLLAACKVHGDRELGKVAIEKIMELRPCDAGAYVSVSNIFAEAGDWEEVKRIRGSMDESGVRKKEAGWSFV